MDKKDEFFTPQDIANTLHISYDVALHLIKTEIPFIKVGRKYKVRVLKFRQWYRQKETEIV